MLIRAVAIGSALLPMIVVGPTQADPGRCAVVDGTGRCLVAAADPGRPGGPQDRSRRAVPRGPAAEAPDSVVPPERRRITEIRTPEEAGIVAYQAALAGTPAYSPQAALAAGGPAAGPVAAAAVLAQQAVEELTLKAPTIQLSVGDAAFVGVPIWLWIERGAQAIGPVSTTAVAGAARVTATGRLSGVEWSMGPPGAQVRCAGPGTPWAGQRGPSPDCGFVYTTRSLPERTAGTGRWTITATSVWQVDWSGTSQGVPVSGAQTVRVASQRTLAVGEVQVLVTGGGQ